MLPGPPGGATGKTLQAPIRGLQRAFSAQQAPQMMAADEAGAEGGPDRSALGGRLPQEPFAALMDVVRRFGKVY
jgi:hypothetical protein